MQLCNPNKNTPLTTETPLIKYHHHTRVVVECLQNFDFIPPTTSVIVWWQHYYAMPKEGFIYFCDTHYVI
jgi:hypothetical protein